MQAEALRVVPEAACLAQHRQPPGKAEKLDPKKCLERAWSRQTVERFQRQKTDPCYAMELHAIRLGDVEVNYTITAEDIGAANRSPLHTV